jgi:uridylate kinase
MPKTVLLKLSGESLQSKSKKGIDPAALKKIAREISLAYNPKKVRIAVVVGGGNIWRGGRGQGTTIPRTTSDYMGMLATIINAMALQTSLENMGIPTRIQTAIEVSQIAEPFIRRRAIRHLEKGRIVIFAGGTGNPYFTTDTAAALRASEINASMLLKATQVEGVYTDDPNKNPKAKPIKQLSFKQAISKNLKFMDSAALGLCFENNIPIGVFSLHKSENIKRAILSEKVATIIK